MDSAYYNLTISPDRDILPAFETSDEDRIRIDFLAGEEILNPTTPYQLTVSAAQKDELISTLTAPGAFVVSASEILTDAPHSMPLDEETVEAFLSSSPEEPEIDTSPVTLTFTSTPLLDRVEIGHHLVQTTLGSFPLFSFRELRTVLLDDGTVDNIWVTFPAAFVVTHLTRHENTTEFTGHFEKIELDSGSISGGALVARPGIFSAPSPFRVLNSFFIEKPTDRPYDTNYPPETQEAVREYVTSKYKSPDGEIHRVSDHPIASYLSAFKPEPHVIDNFEIVPGVILNGYLTVRPVDLETELVWKDRKLHQFVVRYTSSLYLNVIVETRGGADNRSVPDIEKAISLLDVSLPGLSIPLGSTNLALHLSPSVALGINTEVFLPGKATIPIQTGFTIGGELIYHRGSFSTKPIREVLPPLISKSELEKALEAQVNLGISADLGLNYDVGIVGVNLEGNTSLPLLYGDVTFGANVDTSFLLNPLVIPGGPSTGT